MNVLVLFHQLLFPIAGIGILVAIALASRRYLRTLPKEASRSPLFIRFGEAATLLLIGVAVFVIGSTDSNINGMLLRLGELHPSLARAHLVLAACTVAIGLYAVFLAFAGRTSLGVLVMTGVLCAFGLMINGPGNPINALADVTRMTRTIPYTISLGETNVVGADLWVNDVYLGKTPVDTTLEEFMEKVSYWPTPPEGFDSDTYTVELPSFGPFGGGGQVRRKLIEFKTPEFGDDQRPEGYQSGTYYARVEYGGEQGLGGRGGGGSGGGSGFSYRANTYFNVVFPERDKRLDRLFDQARLADYKVGPAWFEALETYGDDGWLGLRAVAEKEPEFLDIFDDWAQWHYNLDGVNDAESAWHVFSRIRDEADAAQIYVTPSLAGHAIESIAPLLDPERLVEEAERLLTGMHGYNYIQWDAYGNRNFGIVTRPQGFCWRDGESGSSQFCGWGRGGPLPANAAAVAHAVWLLDQRLDSEQKTEPNIVEQRVVPMLIRKAYPFEHMMRVVLLQAAVALGGPAVDGFLLRQDWRSRIDKGRRGVAEMNLGGVSVNGWLYLLAHLRTPEGATFRKRHADEVLKLVWTLCEHDYASRWNRDLDVLFWELDRGEQSLAFQFWPQYRDRPRPDDPGRLHTQWQYLVRMEPLTAPEMYAQCLVEMDGMEFELACRALDQLPDERRAVVVDTLMAEARKTWGNDRPEDLSALESRKDPRQYLAEALLKDLHGEGRNERGKTIVNWLEHMEPGSPLVGMLAKDSDAGLRMLVMGALREHPTPANRAILEALLKDAEPAVRKAAEGVKAALEELTETDPMTFASDPTATAGSS